MAPGEPGVDLLLQTLAVHQDLYPYAVKEITKQNIGKMIMYIYCNVLSKFWVMLLVGRQDGHSTSKNFYFKTAWAGS